MALDARDGARRMADRVTAPKAADDWVCMLQLEQRAVGNSGSLYRGVCVDRFASLSFPHESSRPREVPTGEQFERSHD